MLIAAMVLAAAFNSPVEDRAVFTQKIEAKETSRAGKIYTRTITITYVDLNGDGQASKIDTREKDVRKLAGFVRQELPGIYKARFQDRLRAIGHHSGRVGA